MQLPDLTAQNIRRPLMDLQHNTARKFCHWRLVKACLNRMCTGIYLDCFLKTAASVSINHLKISVSIVSLLPIMSIKLHVS